MAQRESSRERYHPLDINRVPEVTFFRIYVEKEVDEYYWRVDFKGQQPHPDERVLTGATSVRDTRMHHLLCKDIKNFSENINIWSYRELVRQKKDIGYKIYTHLGLKSVFDKLWELPPEGSEGIDSIIMVTNDYDIPWDWAWPKNKKESLGERFIIGYIPLGRIEEYKMQTSSKTEKYWDDAKEVKSNAKIVLFGDSCGESPQYHIEALKEKLNEIKILFEKKFKEKNIEKLYGEEDSLQRELSGVFKDAENIDIIHYMGHITKEGNIPHRYGRIEPKRLADLCPDETGVMRDRGSLIFLNGCSAGNIKDIYQKTDQLITVFMEHGARLCMAPRWPIPLYEANMFAKTFYKVLLGSLESSKKFGNPISEIIRKTRDMYRREHPSKGYKEISHLENLLPYLYFLYGNPAESVFWKSPPDRYLHKYETEEETIKTFPDPKKILSK